MEIETLLAAIAPDSPCGPDLEYDQDFMALEQAGRAKPEQQFGDTIVPAEEPDWADVRKRAEALFARTKDVRVAVLLTRALTKTEDFVGLASGLAVCNELISRYWDGVHPALDPDEDNDPTMRLNAMSQLADADTFIRDVRAMHLVPPGRHGRLSVRDILILLGKFPAAGAEGTPSQSEMEGILRSSAAENAAQVSAARESLRLVGTLHSQLAEKVGIDRVPDLQPLREILKSVVQVCDTVLGTGEEAAAAEEGEGAAAEGSAPGQRATGALRTREDALRLLDRVCEFIERTEPSSPVPLLIRRAQRLMNMNFVQILEDLAPDGLSQARSVTGIDKQ
jgi:type VI secretion system protein ImpA